MSLPPLYCGGNQERVTLVLVILDIVTFTGADGGSECGRASYDRMMHNGKTNASLATLDMHSDHTIQIHQCYHNPYCNSQYNACTNIWTYHANINEAINIIIMVPSCICLRVQAAPGPS